MTHSTRSKIHYLQNQLDKFRIAYECVSIEREKLNVNKDICDKKIKNLSDENDFLKKNNEHMQKILKKLAH